MRFPAEITNFILEKRRTKGFFRIRKYRRTRRRRHQTTEKHGKRGNTARRGRQPQHPRGTTVADGELLRTRADAADAQPAGDAAARGADRRRDLAEKADDLKGKMHTIAADAKK